MINSKRALPILLFLFTSLTSIAQNIISLNIQTADDNGKALSGSVVYSAKTYNNVYKIQSGNSTIDVPSSSSCYFEISFDGYTTVFFDEKDLIKESEKSWRLPDILLRKSEELTASVAVAQSRHLTIDRNLIVYDVSSDPDAANKPLGALLNSMPLLKVSPDNGKVSLLSDGGLAITLDGKRSLLVSESNIDYIAKILKGRHLKSLSLNTDPDGQYANQSAVLNIESSVDVSSLIAGRADVRASDKAEATPSLSVTTKAGKIVSDIAYSYTHSNTKPVYSNTERTSDKTSYVSRDTSDLRRRNGHDLSLKTSFDLSSKDVLFSYLKGGLASSKSTYGSYYASDLFSVSSSVVGHSDLRSSSLGFALQHTLDDKKGSMITAQYDFDGKWSTSEQTGSFISDNSTSDRQHQVALDWLIRSRGKTTGYIRGIGIDRNYTSNKSGISLLDHSQKIAGIMGNMSYRTPKITLFGDLGYEHVWDNASYTAGATDLKRDGGDITFVGRLMWFPKRGHTFRLNINNQVFRPSIEWLNPFMDESVSGYVSSGNPALDNQNTYSLMAGYTYMKGRKFTINPLLSYRWSNNGLYAVNELMDDGRMLRTYDNVGKMRALIMSVSLNWSPNDRVRFTLMESIRRYSFFEGIDSNSYWENFCFADGTFMLWKGANFNSRLQYANPDAMISFDPQAHRMHYVLTDWYSLSQSINSWTFSLRVSHPLKARLRETREQKTSDYTMSTVTLSPQREVGIYVSYTFGSLKERVRSNSRQVTVTDRQKSN